MKEYLISYFRRFGNDQKQFRLVIASSYQDAMNKILNRYPDAERFENCNL